MSSLRHSSHASGGVDSSSTNYISCSHQTARGTCIAFVQNQCSLQSAMAPPLPTLSLAVIQQRRYLSRTCAVAAAAVGPFGGGDYQWFLSRLSLAAIQQRAVLVPHLCSSSNICRTAPILPTLYLEAILQRAVPRGPKPLSQQSLEPSPQVSVQPTSQPSVNRQDSHWSSIIPAAALSPSR